MTRQTVRTQPINAEYSPWIAASGLLAFAAAMGIGRFAFTPLLPMMQAEGLLSVSEGGLLASVHFFGYLLGTLAAARLQLDPRTMLTGSLVLIAASTAGMGLTDEFSAWLVSRFIAGVCSACTLVAVSMHIVRQLAGIGQIRAQGWVFAGVGAGIAFVGIAALGMMLKQVMSGDGWLVFGAVTLAVAAFVSLQQRNCDDPAAKPAHTHTLRVPLSWPILMAYGSAGAGYIIPATFLPVMARDLVADPIIFGWGWPVFGAAAFVSTLIAARLYATFTNIKIWTGSQFVMAAGLILPALYTTSARF